MTSGVNRKEEKDVITYLPIDRSRAAEKVYTPTDPRAAKPKGGMHLGKSFPMVLAEAMPPLQAEWIAHACDNLVRGKETYASLLYLNRARSADTAAVLAASQSPELKIRWERLWVLSPTMARLARQEEGKQALLEGFKEDLTGVHLLSKFADQNNHAVKRLFARLHDPLLEFLMDRLLFYQSDPRRTGLLVNIIGTIEKYEEPLRKAMGPNVDAQTAGRLLRMLHIRYPSGYGKRLSSRVLCDKLQEWRH